MVNSSTATDLIGFFARECRACGMQFLTDDGRTWHCSRLCSRASLLKHQRRRQATHRASHPLRDLCRQTLKNAVQLGKVRRPDRCEGCGDQVEVDGHHSDYERPFFVRWLCVACHAGLEGGRHFGAGQPKPDVPVAGRPASWLHSVEPSRHLTQGQE